MQTIRVPYGYTSCCHPLVIAHTGSFRSSDMQKVSVFPRDAIPPLVTAWKRQNVPNIVACGINLLVITPRVQPLVTAWNRQKVPIVAACSITSLYNPPRYHTPCSAGGMLRVPNISHRTSITPRRYQPPGENTPGDKKNSNKIMPISTGVR